MCIRQETEDRRQKEREKYDTRKNSKVFTDVDIR